MSELIEGFKQIVMDDGKIWEELDKKYSKEVVRKAASITACGCATCTKNLLETGFPHYPFK